MVNVNTNKLDSSSYHKADHRNHILLSNNSTNDYHKANEFTIFHQNVREISHKKDELLISLIPHSPQVLCLTQHHLQTDEISMVNLGQYTLEASFCRQTHKQGGVCIYISEDIQFNIINLDQYNSEKDLEICAVNILLPSNSITVICIYRSPTGNFNYFLKQLESALTKTYSISTTLILCGDFNINHLEDNSRNHFLESLLASFGLSVL
jgi:exonuclease III